MKMTTIQTTAPNETLLYPNTSTLKQSLIKVKIEANNNFNNCNKFLEDLINSYETETNN